MLKRSKLIFLTLWELANNPKPYKKQNKLEDFEIEIDN